mmetsp:Transcript_131720/g.227836  ORF Transcript_131720/g.227836 Transcript_131720/m.227836 type:complete len:661 (-) Transcript_131720:113-2095(-)
MGRSRSRGGTRGRRRSPSRSRSRGRGRLRSWSREREDAKRPSSSQAKGMVGQQNKSMKKVRKELFASELGYKDDSNPFGDVTLSDKFVWKKKNEYLAAAGLYKKSSRDQEYERAQAKIREIEQVKKRRDEREVERQLLEQQRLEHDKDMKDELFGEWLGMEEKFHLENAKARSIIRIQQGRERPIDLASKGLMIADGDEFEDMTILDKYPHQLFIAMSLQEVDDTMTEIEAFIRNDTQHKPFWKAMKYCCQDAYDQKQKEKVGRAKPGAQLSGLGAGVAEGVAGDIHELLSSKGKGELEDMLIEIKANLNKGDAGVDTQFFDAVASKIPLYMARAEIEEYYNKAKRKVDKWMEEHRPAEPEFDDGAVSAEEAEEPALKLAQPPAPGLPTSFAAKGSSDWDDLPVGGPPGDDDGDLSPALEPLSVLDEARRGAGAYSPVLEPISAFDPQDLLDPMEDEKILKQVRRTLIEAFRDPDADAGASGSAGDAGVDRSRDNELLEQERRKGMGQDEVAFNAMGKGTGDDVHGEVAVPSRSYEWEDKYKPRKPRFFNRVKTGYEWNKYNQTHYDHDNPPPKIVQGYKFNIFYPDLIDKTKAPNYYLEKDGSNETCTLRFHAGPPYEDVAFKIVNREWNLSHRFGFRVVFDRGVLQLYFNFKRWRYRR